MVIEYVPMRKIIARFLGRARQEALVIPEYVPNTALRVEMIPARNAPWNDIVMFSLSFNPYHKAGDFNRCTELDGSGECESLTGMRAFLYGRQRCFSRQRREPDRETMDLIYDVLDRMREMVSRGELD